MILRAGKVGRVSPVTAIAVRKFHAVEADRLNRKRTGAPGSPEWNYYESMIKRGERWNTW